MSDSRVVTLVLDFTGYSGAHRNVENDVTTACIFQIKSVICALKNVSFFQGNIQYGICFMKLISFLRVRFYLLQVRIK